LNYCNTALITKQHITVDIFEGIPLHLPGMYKYNLAVFHVGTQERRSYQIKDFRQL
jgi:hypothetical protein